MPSIPSFLRPAAMLLGMACLPVQAQPGDFGGYGQPGPPLYDRQALRSCADYGYRVSRGACAYGGRSGAAEGWGEPRGSWGADPGPGAWGGADGWAADPGFAERGARPLRGSGMESRWPPWEEPEPARNRPSPWLVGPSGSGEPPPPRSGWSQGQAWGPPARPRGEAEWGPRPQPEDRWGPRPEADGDWGARPRTEGGWGGQPAPGSPAASVPSQPRPRASGDWGTQSRAGDGWDGQPPPGPPATPVPSPPAVSPPATGLDEAEAEDAGAAREAAAPAGEGDRDYFWGEVKPPRPPPRSAAPPTPAEGMSRGVTPFGMLPDPWAGNGAAAQGPAPDGGSGAAPAEQTEGKD